jgi:hypothetical protein
MPPTSRPSATLNQNKMSSPLSNRQKFILAALAREAWQQDIKNNPLQQAVSEHEFRHDQVRAATGRSGLTSCTQAHYQVIRAHFLQLLGRDDQALNAHYRDTGNGRRIVRHKINQACAAAGVTLNYANAICKSKYKCNLDDASDRQLWSIKFDLDRASKRRRQPISPAIQ